MSRPETIAVPRAPPTWKNAVLMPEATPASFSLAEDSGGEDHCGQQHAQDAPAGPPVRRRLDNCGDERDQGEGDRECAGCINRGPGLNLTAILTSGVVKYNYWIVYSH
jgi:hypothetical protein